MRRSTAALVLATGLALSACSSDDGGDQTATDPESSSAASESPSAAESPTAAASPSEEAGGGSGEIAPADVAALALAAPDFPAPYEFTPLPPGALQQGGDAVAGALAGATFKPAECGAAVSPTADVDFSQAGAAVGTDQGSGASIAEVVTPAASAPTPDYAAQADACKTFTFTIDSPAGKAEGKASVELLEAPDVEAETVQAARTSVDITVGGQSQTVQTTVYSAELRGVVVVVTGTAPGATPVDTAVIEQVFTAGVEKVAAAS